MRLRQPAYGASGLIEVLGKQMSGEITAKEATRLTNPVFIDLRSPAEYSKGSIPGAVNIPLFDDREREIIGTAYKHDQQQARSRGVAFASSKLPHLCAAIEELGQKGTPVLFCWRGGQRSKVLYELLRSLEIEVFRLEGGYKAYRRFILDLLSGYVLQKPVYLLNGLTGVGKTAVLQLLQEMDCPAINLEGLAMHRGSLFGHLGLATQRAQKDFDALLLKRLSELDDSDYLLLEGEGKRIGPVYLPDFLFKAMQQGKHILLTAPLPVRVKRILDDYTPQNEEEHLEVRKAILGLEKYVGKQAVLLLLQFLDEANYKELVSWLCLNYYDRLYDDANPHKKSFVLTVDSSNLLRAAETIQKYIGAQQHAGTTCQAVCQIKKMDPSLNGREFMYQ